MKTPKEVSRLDAIWKSFDPSWSACPTCGGIRTTICTNGCDLSARDRERFSALMNFVRKTG